MCKESLIQTLEALSKLVEQAEINFHDKEILLHLISAIETEIKDDLIVDKRVQHCIREGFELASRVHLKEVPNTPSTRATIKRALNMARTYLI